MLTRIQKAIAIVALSICLGMAIGAEIWQASHSPQSPNQRATAKDNYGTSSKTIEERHQATEEAIAYYTLWLMAFTGILAIATAGLGTMNFFQLRLARAEFLSTHRPKIRIKHLWLVGGVASEIWQGEPIIVNLTCVNNGTTDAILHEVGIKYLVVKKDRGLLTEPDIPAVLNVRGAALPCGRNWTIEDLRVGTVITAEQNVDIQQHRADLYCIGYVSYFDAAERMRITGFCRILTFPQNALAHTGNCRFRVFDDPDYEYED